MNTHTPGPWTIDTSYDARSGPHTYIQREYDGDGVTGIAGIYTIAEAADQAFLPEGVQEANARLIAAAPDLRDMLSLLVRTVWDTFRHRHSKGQWECLEEATNDAAALLKRFD